MNRKCIRFFCMILVCWYKFVSLCLQGWIFAHFKQLVPRKRYEDYNRRTRMWVDGNLPRGFLMLDTSEEGWIQWSILMSPGGRTSTDETWRLFRTYVSTLDGSWSAKPGWCVTCRSRFWGSTTMFRPFPDLLRQLSLLSQCMWLRPS